MGIDAEREALFVGVPCLRDRFRSTGAPLAPKAGTSLKPDTESTSQEFISTGAPLAPRYAQALLPEWRFTMKKCPNCQRVINGNETFCIRCGTEFPERDPAPVSSAKSANLIRTSNQTRSQYGQAIAQLHNSNDCGAQAQEEPIRKRSQFHSRSTTSSQTNLFSKTVTFIQTQVLPAIQSLKQSNLLSKDKNIALISILLTILLLTGAHLYIQHALNPQTQAAHIAKYVEKNKPDRLAAAFTYTEKTYVNPKSFYTYLHDNQWILEELQHAAKEAKKLGRAEIKDESGNRIISISNQPFLFFYKKYEFRVRPVKALVSTTDPGLGATITVGNKEPVPIDKDRVNVGYFAPGPYEFTIAYQDDYFVKEDKVEVYLSGEQYEFPIHLKLQPVELTSDIPDAIVYINGKNTKKTAEEIQLTTVPLDGSVEIYAVATNENGEKIKSNTLHLTKSATHITFPDAKSNRALYESPATDAETWIGIFRRDYEKAVNLADFDYVADYFIPGSPAEEEYRNFVEGHQNRAGYQYNFLSNEILHAAILSDNSILIETREAFEYHSEDEGDWYYERQKKYTLQNNDGLFKIADIESNTIKKERRS